MVRRSPGWSWVGVVMRWPLTVVPLVEAEVFDGGGSVVCDGDGGVVAGGFFVVEDDVCVLASADDVAAGGEFLGAADAVGAA